MKRIICSIALLLFFSVLVEAQVAKVSLDVGISSSSSRVIVETPDGFEAMELDEVGIITLASQDNVIWIHEDKILHIFDTVNLAELVGESIRLRQVGNPNIPHSLFFGGSYHISTSMRFHKLTPSNINVGEGISICVLDTGIDSSHPYFIHNEIIEANFVDGEPLSDLNGHGTHVAGIISKIVPSATIFSGKVCNAGGGCWASDILSGLEWCASQGADLISMSFGTTHYSEPCNDYPISIKVNELADNGIIPIAAAGNKALFERAKVSIPACAEKSLAVSAISLVLYRPIFSDHLIFSPANYDVTNSVVINGVPFDPGFHLIDIYANGDVVSAGLGGGEVAKSGTSMSTPHITGALAQLMYSNPSKPPSSLISALKEGSIVGHSRLNPEPAGLLDNANSCALLNNIDIPICNGYFTSLTTFPTRADSSDWVRAEINGDTLTFRYSGTIRVNKARFTADTYYPSSTYRDWTVNPIGVSAAVSGGKAYLLYQIDRRGNVVYEWHEWYDSPFDSSYLLHRFRLHPSSIPIRLKDSTRFISMDCEELDYGACNIIDDMSSFQELYPFCFDTEVPELVLTLTIRMPYESRIVMQIKSYIERFIARYASSFTWDEEIIVRDICEVD